MTVLTLALLAGSQPAAPRLAPVHQIGPQSRRQSPHTPCAPLVRTAALTLTWQKADRHKRSAPTSSSHTPWPNPHSACGTAAAPLPAISCLGAFRPPAARARGEVRHCRQPKTCTNPVGEACLRHVRFTPDSGHAADRLGCRLRAKCGQAAYGTTLPWALDSWKIGRPQCNVDSLHSFAGR